MVNKKQCFILSFWQKTSFFYFEQFNYFLIVGRAVLPAFLRKQEYLRYCFFPECQSVTKQQMVFRERIFLCYFGQ